MKISRKNFLEKLEKNSLRIAFVGMSNIGKSLRARQLELDKNFERVAVDEQILQFLNFKNFDEISRWLGFPFDENFFAHQKKYLAAEKKFTEKNYFPKKNFVLDTTGSVIYLPKTTIDFLKKNFLVVHFVLPKNFSTKILQNFFERPKPLIWGDIFEFFDAPKKKLLAKNYEKLLDFREKKYREIADFSIEIFREKKILFDEFWKIFLENLPEN